MEQPQPTPSERAFAEGTRADQQRDLVLRLYVAGMTARSANAIRSIKSICEENFPGRYALEVFDLYQSPAAAQAGNVIAAPTLVRVEPLPEVRLIGSLDDRARVLRSLGRQAAGQP
jgi:circadian clock protein KaiB